LGNAPLAAAAPSAARVERMARAGPAVQLRGAPGAEEAAGVVDVLVEERIERADREVSRGQAGEIARAGRRGVPGDVAAPRRPAEIGGPRIDPVLAAPEQRLRPALARRARGPVVEGGIDQQL